MEYGSVQRNRSYNDVTSFIGLSFLLYDRLSLIGGPRQPRTRTHSVLTHPGSREGPRIGVATIERQFTMEDKMMCAQAQAIRRAQQLHPVPAPRVVSYDLVQVVQGDQSTGGVSAKNG